jgi:hypothetical protein
MIVTDLAAVTRAHDDRIFADLFFTIEVGYSAYAERAT